MTEHIDPAKSDCLDCSTNLIRHLDRIQINRMSNWELDAGASMAMGQMTRLTEETRVIEAYRDGAWKPFSPTSSWEDFGLLVSGFEMVLGTHGTGADDNPRWYSAHAFISGTKCHSYEDIRLAAAMAATSYGRQMNWVMVPKEKPEAPALPDIRA